MLKKILFILFLIIIFFLAIGIWYSPILFKGYPVHTTGSDALVRARNYSLTGKYAAENKLNVILAPELIKKQSQPSFYSNKLGTLLYSYPLKWFNINNNNSAVLLNCLLLALALIFFSLTVYYLFNFKTALFFSLIYVLLPSNWDVTQLMIGYSVALVFLSLFFLFFSLGTQKFTRDKNIIKSIKFWPHGLCLILAGIFLILACASREALILILPILFIFLIFQRLKKYLLYIFIPLIIIACLVYLPGLISGENVSLVLINHSSNSQTEAADFHFYSHLFPDPYTYHFNQTEFIENKLKNQTESDILQQIGTQKVLASVGFLTPNLWQRFQIGTTHLFRHIFRLFSITEIGGVLIFLLIFLGFYVLKKYNTYWSKFFIWWLMGSYLIMAYIVFANRNHNMDFGWLFALCTSLGIFFIADSFKDKFKKKNIYLAIFILVFTLYNLVLANHVMWGQNYDQSFIPYLNAYTSAISQKEISSSEVIAVPFDAGDAYNLNFTTQKNVVVFRQETIQQLIKQNQLSSAFNTFQVSHILGYDPNLTKKITELTSVINIADSSIPISFDSQEINNKNWFLNLIK